MRARILEAAGAELLEGGYDALSIPRVAEMAGVARSTVYRRWPTRGQLAADVLVSLNEDWVPEGTGGTLSEQLLDIARNVTHTITQPHIAAMIRGLLALPPNEAKPLQHALLTARSEAYDRMVADAHQRGELNGTVDGWALVESVIAPIWMRVLVTGAPVDDPWLTSLTARAIRGFSAESGPGAAGCVPTSSGRHQRPKG